MKEYNYEQQKIVSTNLTRLWLIDLTLKHLQLYNFREKYKNDMTNTLLVITDYFFSLTANHHRQRKVNHRNEGNHYDESTAAQWTQFLL